VNLVAPEAVRNAEFAHTLGRVLNRPSVIPLPAFALELVYGEMAKTTILAGQHVIPRALLANGFSFDDPTLEAGLRRALSPSGV
jgi:NAD dependent epimerase/dehydratase family enzyme